MSRFSVEDYKAALKGAGPKTTKMIIDRAIEDGLSAQDFYALCDFAYPDPAYPFGVSDEALGRTPEVCCGR